MQNIVNICFNIMAIIGRYVAWKMLQIIYYICCMVYLYNICSDLGVLGINI